MYVVTVNVPNLGKGEVVEIDGLGNFENGYEYQVSADEANFYRTKHSTQVVSYSADGTANVETTQGPTLLQAFKSFDGIDVRRMTDEELAAFNEVNQEPEDNESTESKEGDQ